MRRERGVCRGRGVSRGIRAGSHTHLRYMNRLLLLLTLCCGRLCVLVTWSPGAVGHDPPRPVAVLLLVGHSLASIPKPSCARHGHSLASSPKPPCALLPLRSPPRFTPWLHLLSRPSQVKETCGFIEYPGVAAGASDVDVPRTSAGIHRRLDLHPTSGPKGCSRY